MSDDAEPGLGAQPLPEASVPERLAPEVGGVGVPDASAERALEQLERWASDPEQRVIVVCGPAPVTNSLLGVFAAGLGDRFRIVRLSDPRADPDTLSRRILDSLGELDDERPRTAFARAIHEPRAAALLVLVDEADVLSPRSEMWLFDLVRRSGGALRVALAIADAKPARELAEAFSARTEVVPIDAPDRIQSRSGGGRVARERTAVAQARREERVLIEESGAPTSGEGAQPGSAERARAVAARATSRPKASSAPPAARKAPSPESAPRDSLLRWLVLPGALAACFVAGFVTSELLHVLRDGPAGGVAVPMATSAAGAPEIEKALPSVGSAPPSQIAAPQAAQPPIPVTPTPVSPAPPAQPLAEAPAVVPQPAASAPPAPQAQPPQAQLPQAQPPQETASAPPVEPEPPASASSAETPPPRDSPGPERRRARAAARLAGPPPVPFRVSAEPGTEISVDGRSLGAAPVEEVELARGPHHLVARLPDGRVVERVVDVQGSSYDVRVR